ncbi:winged helix-turn-helix transcriptional regulator [Propionibacteriaceae bacterium G57]|uniref:winged helix-turn-helix transcriptional regulator n=1 Tax=Aestuariimicrobium sp. G57 TaxID=3418485 RepID=UPI003DA6E15A
MIDSMPPGQDVPPAADVFSSACSSRDVLQHLTGRWGALAMVALLREDDLRFGELRRRVGGISDRMLSQTLGQLERDGFVQRTVHSAIPPHVEYSLTPLGACLCREVRITRAGSAPSAASLGDQVGGSGVLGEC